MGTAALPVCYLNTAQVLEKAVPMWEKRESLRETHAVPMWELHVCYLKSFASLREGRVFETACVLFKILCKSKRR